MNEARLSEPLAAVAQIAADLEGFRDGGPDKETEHLALALRWGLDADAIRAQWAEARERRPKPLKEITIQSTAARSAGLAARLSAAIEKRESPKALVVAPAPMVVAPAAPPPAPKVPEAVPADVPERGPLRIDLDAPYEVARSYVNYRYSVGGVPTLRRWNGGWYWWNETHYAPLDEETLRAEIYRYLAKANGGKLDPKQKDVNLVVDALKAHVLLPSEVEGGTWLDGDAPWGDGPIMCCKNGVLGLSDGELWPHNPRLFSLNVIETEYRTEAEAPRWMQFLDEVWGESSVEPRDVARVLRACADGRN